MYCDVNHEFYYNQYMNREYSIQDIPKIDDTSGYSVSEDERSTVYCGVLMFNIIFPLIYIILSTGSFTAVLYLWSLIQSSVFDAFRSMKQILTNIIIYMMRVLGCYTFSTYTVVKDGREVFSSASEYFFMKTTRDNIKRVDRAKHSICKWIDKECELYRQLNNGDEPELTETHNDIYDFILHRFEYVTITRIHRGDFRISTHTSLIDNYRIFGKSYQICDAVELRVAIDEVNTEVIFIDIKRSIQFYVEKNIIVDKKFLRWYLYSKLGRKDLADYIGLPYSKYEVIIYYENFMKDICDSFKSSRILAALPEELVAPSTDVPHIRAFTVNDSQYILVGSRYMVKVDSILGCPVVESDDKDVLHIDDVLSNYYENSVCSDTSDDQDQDQDQDQDDESAVTDETDDDNDDDDDDDDNDDNDDNEPEHDVVAAESKNTSLQENEFEIIEPSERLM